MKTKQNKYNKLTKENIIYIELIIQTLKKWKNEKKRDEKKRKRKENKIKRKEKKTKEKKRKQNQKLFYCQFFILYTFKKVHLCQNISSKKKQNVWRFSKRSFYSLTENYEINTSSCKKVVTPRFELGSREPKSRMLPLHHATFHIYVVFCITCFISLLLIIYQFICHFFMVSFGWYMD